MGKKEEEEEEEEDTVNTHREYQHYLLFILCGVAEMAPILQERKRRESKGCETLL